MLLGLLAYYLLGRPSRAVLFCLMVSTVYATLLLLTRGLVVTFMPTAAC